MTKFSIETKVELTDDGRVGAALFLLAPIASGIIYPFLASAIVGSRLGLTGSANGLVFLSLLMLISVCAFLGGFIMLLLGRRYEHQVEVQRE